MTQDLVTQGTDEESFRGRLDDLAAANALLRAEIAERKAVEAAIRYRLDLETAVSRISQALVSGNQVDLDGTLGVLGEAMQGDRCTVLLFREDGRTLDATYEWCAAGIPGAKEQRLALDLGDYPWWFDRLRRHENIVIPDVEGMPEEAAVERERFRTRGTRAVVAVPMLRAGTLIGLLGFEDTRGPRNWSEADVQLFRSVAEILVGYFERVRAEKALAASEERHRLIAENVSDVIWTMDLDFRFTYISPSVQRLTGHTPEEQLAMSLDQILTPESRSRIAAEMAGIGELIARNERLDEERRIFELEEYRKDGTVVPTEVTVSFLLDNEGRPIGLLGITRDITERRRAEEERRRLEQQLRQAQKMEAIGTLAGGLAHDLNNMLVPILGYAELALLQVEDRPELREQLQQILDAGRRARDLVSHILAFGRQREGARRPLKLDTVVREALQLLRASLPATVAIHAEIEPDVDLVLADATQVHQVLMNLCVNAAQAMPEGGKLRVSVCNDGPPPGVRGPAGTPGGRFVRLTVADTGTGMDPETVARIFDPYFTTKPQGQGTGLGLAVVHGIVYQHGGLIRVESAPGKGSAFHVYLPVAPRMAQATVLTPAVRGGNERILIVDDERAVALLMARTLERAGYTVISRNDPREALDLFAESPESFDLVITDLTMPGLTGDKLAGEIQHLRPDIPVLLCTGFGADLTPLEVKGLGIRSVVMKPIVGADLCREVRRVLDAGSEARPVGAGTELQPGAG